MDHYSFMFKRSKYYSNSIMVLLPFSNDIIRHFGANALLSRNQLPDLCQAA